MMTPQAAEALLRNEIASGSLAGKAILVLLQDAEVQSYRQTERITDPCTLARLCGRGEGLHAMMTRITPVQNPAHPGRGDSAAERNHP